MHVKGLAGRERSTEFHALSGIIGNWRLVRQFGRQKSAGSGCTNIFIFTACVNFVKFALLHQRCLRPGVCDHFQGRVLLNLTWIGLRMHDLVLGGVQLRDFWIGWSKMLLLIWIDLILVHLLVLKTHARHAAYQLFFFLLIAAIYCWLNIICLGRLGEFCLRNL